MFYRKEKQVKYWKIMRLVCRESFYFFSFAFLIFSVLEIVFPGFVSVYLNLNYWLFLGLISGIILLLLPPAKENSK